MMASANLQTTRREPHIRRALGPLEAPVTMASFPSNGATAAPALRLVDEAL